jgi:hypothetical protein
VRRTRLVGAQAELLPTWRYHAFVTNRVGTTVWLDQDHRRHATVELCIRDLKAGVGLRHCPSGKFAANAAWLLAATLAHNLLRWVAAIGLGARGELVVAKTLRRTLLNLPGRLTRSARRWTLLCRPAGRGRRGSSWHWLGCAASTTPPDPPLPDRARPKPTRASVSLPGHAWPAARALPIAQTGCHAISIMPQRTPQPSSNRLQPAGNSGVGGSRLN